MLDAHLRSSLLCPPIRTHALPGIGGELRCVPDDFTVTEIPAYAPDGREGAHVFLTLRKRNLATHEAVELLARHVGVPSKDIGFAGRKDKDACTVQWISVPASAASNLPSFRHPDIELGPPMPHGHKLRVGHLRGNRFKIVIRRPDVPRDEAMTRLHTKLETLDEAAGIDNVFGPQRFGREGFGFDRGLEDMQRGRGGARGNMRIAAAQAGLFNLYVVLRQDRGLSDRALEGDILEKTQTGGMFVCTDPELDTQRLLAGEIGITGPIFGSRMKAPPEGTPASALEAEVLALAEVSQSALEGLGRRALGTRRSLRVCLDTPTVEPAEPHPVHGDGIAVAFSLPAGSFATRVCEELQQPR